MKPQETSSCNVCKGAPRQEFLYPCQLIGKAEQMVVSSHFMPQNQNKTKILPKIHANAQPRHWAVSKYIQQKGVADGYDFNTQGTLPKFYLVGPARQSSYKCRNSAELGIRNEFRYFGISVLPAVLSGTEISNTTSVPIPIPNG